MVLAVLVLGLPKHEQKKALRYGILGAFVFRTIAILLAAFLIRARLGEAARRRLPAVPGLPPLLQRSRAADDRRTPPKAQAVARPDRVLGDGGQGGVDRHRLRHRLDSRRRRDVAEAVGDPDRRHSGHHHDAAGHRPVAGAGRALPAAGRRRVRHHRLGRHQAADRVPAHRGLRRRSRSRSGCRSG